MRANPTIYTTLLAFVLGASELLAQSSSTALPNAPTDAIAPCRVSASGVSH